MADIDQLTSSQIAAGVAAGDFSATEVCHAALDAVTQRDRDVDAFLEITYDMALDRAHDVDRAVRPARCSAPWPACPWPSRTT